MHENRALLFSNLNIKQVIHFLWQVIQFLRCFIERLPLLLGSFRQFLFIVVSCTAENVICDSVNGWLCLFQVITQTMMAELPVLAAILSRLFETSKYVVVEELLISHWSNF